MSDDTFQNFLNSSSTVLDIPSEISSEKFGQLVIRCLVQRAKIDSCLWSQWILFAAIELFIDSRPPALDIKTVTAIQQNCARLRNCCNGHTFPYLTPVPETVSTGVQTYSNVTDASTSCNLRPPTIAKTSKAKCTQTQISVESRGVNTHREDCLIGLVHVACQTSKSRSIYCYHCAKRKSEAAKPKLMDHVGCQTEPPWKLRPLKLAVSSKKTVEKAPKVISLSGDSKLKVFYGRPLCESDCMQTPIIPLFPITEELCSVDPRI